MIDVIGKQIAAGTEHLPELDKSGAEFLKGQPKTYGQ
jgi:hypothetical protein